MIFKTKYFDFKKIILKYFNTFIKLLPIFYLILMLNFLFLKYCL